VSTKLQPLLNRANFLPDESLLSLLIRLTDLNSYDSLSILKGLVLDDPSYLEHVSDDFEIPSKARTYEKLSILTQLDVHSLYMATLHRFAPILTSPPNAVAFMRLPNDRMVPYHSQFRFPIQLRSQNTAQFCPKCLAEGAYHKLIWSPVAVSACLQHKCLLVDRCSKCNKDVSVFAIVKSQCEQCQADLTKAQIISVGNDAFGLSAQQVILSWFMEDKTPDVAAPLLPQHPVSVLYKVLEDLQKCIKNLRMLIGLTCITLK
jgi:TniQ